MIEVHKSSLDKMLAFRKKYLEGKKEEPLLVLDIGSLDINGSYREFFDISPWVYRGMDTVSGKNVDIILKNPYKWREIKSESADILISGQAFEHIEFFWITMLEIARVLKPGGLCCIIAPSGGFEHRYPVDCWRFYSDGFAALARFARLEVVEVSTQWDPDPGYADDSNIWQDTRLVCKKPLLSLLETWREQVRRSVLQCMITR
jgi:SAM-dependent methyltransferase